MNAKGKATKYTYNAVNRLNKVADPLGDATFYANNPVGNVTSETDTKRKRASHIR